MTEFPDRIDEIRGDVLLPARREPVRLHTADGLELVGELASPMSGASTATLVTLHPLPTHGGSSDSHIYRKAAARLPELAGISVLRFNTRGTSSSLGTSEGTFDSAEDERFDVAAAIEYVDFAGLAHPWLLGWSFGTDLALMHGCDPAVEGAILLSPPLRFSKPEHLKNWAASGKPVVAVVPEFDDYLQPAEAMARFRIIPQARVIGVDGAKHLWVGETAVRRVLDEIVQVVVPGAPPLPTSWVATDHRGPGS